MILWDLHVAAYGDVGSDDEELERAFFEQSGQVYEKDVVTSVIGSKKGDNIGTTIGIRNASSSKGNNMTSGFTSYAHGDISKNVKSDRNLDKRRLFSTNIRKNFTSLGYDEVVADRYA